jgi:hypothetical protein
MVVFDVHRHSGADPGETISHESDQRPVAQTNNGRDIDAVEQRARLVGLQHRRLARLDHMLRTAHRMGRIGGDDLTGHQPIEQHPNARQMLFDRRFLEIRSKRLDIGRDVQRLDVGQLADLVLLAPGEEPAGGRHVGHACVPVTDGGGEELQEAPRRMLAGIGDDAGHHSTRGQDRNTGGPADGQLAGWVRVDLGEVAGHGVSVT